MASVAYNDKWYDTSIKFIKVSMKISFLRQLYQKLGQILALINYSVRRLIGSLWAYPKMITITE